MPRPDDHPEYRALHRACLADPLADVPRLALADWLDEHDEPGRAAQLRAGNPYAVYAALRALADAATTAVESIVAKFTSAAAAARS
jgi:uncharacterized protein (TIGR02996 family)